MSNNLYDVSVDFVSLVDRAAVRDPQNKSEPRRFLFWKSAGQNPEGEQMTAEELQAALDKAQADAEAAREETKKAEEAREAAEATRDEALKAGKKVDTDDDDDSEVEKQAFEAAIAKAEAAANERIEKAEKAAMAAQELAKEERDLRLTADFIAKAETFDKLPVAAVEFGPLLKRAAEQLSKEDYTALDSLLKAANEQIAQGKLFTDMGSNVGGSRMPNDAWQEVQQKAQELKKSEPKLSPGEAEARVMKEDPDLQLRYLNSVR